ncbi:sensor histidine kinase [Arcticibacterium luteifluviistationis]|uniref:histidine kinase n=1 Tax=Arcticibacterium luteifluviistationis TaxID=1784714 RepID=A0A2Z4GAA8_9BACT|nr:PAS domain-containing sensor histidine kinase [Arcticibacterium luteifluviistationis]AWV97998.1 hypothetical protein DJ013_07370 [Arcticibacterium luteifluviistationis]
MLERISSSSFIIVRAIAFLVIAISGIAIYGWVVDSFDLITLFSDSATMKFNTALCFCLTGFSVLVFSRKRHVFHKIAIFLTFAIGVYTVLEYAFAFSFSLDNLFVKDNLSSKYPGRMSLGTAICFILMATAKSFSRYRAVKFKRKAIYFLGVILLICILSIITFVLQIPIAGSVFLIDTMSFSTSVLFILLCFAIFKKNNSYGLARSYLKGLAGNRLMKFLFPFVLILPITLSYVLLQLISNGKIDIESGIVLYTLVFTLGGVLYVSFLGIKLNKLDFKRKKLQEFFRTSNEELNQFKYALDQSCLTTITNAEGVITYANDRFCEISKYSRDEILGQTNEILTSNFHSKSFFDNMWTTIKSGEVWTGGIKTKAKDGTFFWVHTAIVPFKDKDGEVYQYLDIRQDITKEKTLSEQYENLKLRNQEIEQFTFIASHDLQEPLNTLKSIVNLLVEEYGPKLDDEAKKYMGFMMETTSRMELLIKGLLDYSRLGRDNSLESISAGEEVNRVLDDLSFIIKESDAKIYVEKLPSLKVYPIEFRLLIQNLLVNSVKFSRKGVVPEIKISALDKGDFWEFTLADNGIGIEKEYSQKVFAIFTRLNHRDDFEGTGIGLAHCEKIVRLHGGTIWFESKVGVGTTFHFTISKNLT